MPVEKRYDRKIRSWVVVRKDDEGNQIGNAVFVATRKEADQAVTDLESEK